MPDHPFPIPVGLAANQAAFGRVFKKHYHDSHGAYRRKMLRERAEDEPPSASA